MNRDDRDAFRAALAMIDEAQKTIIRIRDKIEAQPHHQRRALEQIVDLVNTCEFNGDSGNAFIASLGNLLASIKAVAEVGLQKGPAQ